MERRKGDDAIGALPPELVFAVLNSSPSGLTQAQVADRLREYGHNVIQRVRGRPVILRFLAQFTHLMAVLLWAGGIMAFAAQMPQLGIAIWLVNLINGGFSFWQEYKAERAAEALQGMLPIQARVLREGEERRVPAEALVPGDVLLLAEGDHISADARLVQDAELRVDQSAFTGESQPVRKTSDAFDGPLRAADMPNLVLAGTNIAAGAGKAVVFATGMATAFGQIARLTQSVAEELSPLQREMQVVTRVVTLIAVGVGALFFVMAIAVAGIDLAQGFIFAIGMIVAFVPEGLLPTVTLALAMGAQRMAGRNALIKRLSAVETLGCTNVICTDKTGTLTQNEMTVRALWLLTGRVTVTGVGYAPEGELLRDGEPLRELGDLHDLLLAGALCNDAAVLPPDPDAAAWHILGDPTEAALRVVAAKAGIDLPEQARRLPRARELPFDSRRKRMTTIHRAHADGAAPRLIAFTKGAPREVLALCTRIRCAGQTRDIDASARAEIVAANDDFAREGLRVLAIATRDVSAIEAAGPASRLGLSQIAVEDVERDLTFLGLVAMLDPPRPEVAAAVEKCHRAGIRIIMITGDYGLTAENVARRIGISSATQMRVVTGTELAAMDDRALAEALAGDVIFARAAPEDKLRVVSALQAAGQVVAVTGDGVNDSPALRKADIGVAMGMSGADVAKEAADMILADDNFASIVNAIEEGRAVFANIRKFSTYIFTSNAPEAVPFMLFALSQGRIPLALNVMQVLSIDLGTDIMPALALGAEPPEPGLMDRPPRRLTDHVVTRDLLVRAYLVLGTVQSAAAMAAFYFMYWMNGYWGQWLDLPGQGPLYASATAMALAAVVTTQIGNLFTQRSERVSIFALGRRHFMANRLIWVGIATELILVFGIVYLPPLQALIGTNAFPLSYWVFLFALAPALLVVDEVRKWRLRFRGR